MYLIPVFLKGKDPDSVRAPLSGFSLFTERESLKLTKNISNILKFSQKYWLKVLGEQDTRLFMTSFESDPETDKFCWGFRLSIRSWGGKTLLERGEGSNNVSRPTKISYMIQPRWIRRGAAIGFSLLEIGLRRVSQYNRNLLVTLI